MRNITEHQINGANEELTVEVLDRPGSGGASHLYEIKGFDTDSNPSNTQPGGYVGVDILFQNGPIKEAGINGLTHEVLLAIVADRLRSFQAGPYACTENGQALGFVENALECLLSRTRARMARGVEGTHAK